MTLAAAMPAAAELARDLAAGRTDAQALTEAALDRIAAVDDSLHAFITVSADTARAEARASDARRAAGAALGPLDGIPVAVKDNIAVAGLPRSDGTRAFAGRISAADAGVVARLRGAGAVLLGTLNMHEGALGATTDNPFWGRCRNPLAPDCTPGGSSGGSAAAIAAGMAAITLGTDTMGSVRIPAAYCGLWGLKPTAGLIGSSGLSHLSWTLDSIGPLARSPEDIGLALAVLAGPDPDCPSSQQPPPGWQAMPPAPPALADCVLGVPDAHVLEICEPEVRTAFAALCDAARATGATLRTVQLAGWDPGALRRAGLLVSEAEAGHLLADAIAADPEGFSEGFRKMIAWGSAAPGAKLAGAYRRLLLLRHAARQGLTGLHALLLPTAPQRAFRHDAPVPASQADFTALANAAGLPALAFPLPAADGGLPASAQLIGPAWSEARLIGLGIALHATLAPATHRPGD